MRTKWHNSTTGEPAAESDSVTCCPLCGGGLDEWYGEVDQDIWGNPIYGYNDVCYKCNIGTEMEYDIE